MFGHTMTARSTERLIHGAVPAALVLLLFVGHLVYIRHYGVNLPFWDEWTLGQYVLRQASGELTFAELFAAKHNEHLMGAAFGVMLLHHVATGYDSKSILYLSAALQFASLLVLLALARPLLPRGRTQAWHALVIALLMLSFAPSWNILWGFQTAWYLVTFLFLCCLWFLNRAVRTRQKGGTGSIIAAAACAGLASLSSVHGLAAWLAGGVFLVLAADAHGRSQPASARIMPIVYWIVLGIAFAVTYGWIFSLTPTVHSSSTDLLMALRAGPLALGRFAIGMMSTLWGGHRGGTAVAIGSLAAAICTAAAIGALVSKDRARHALPLSLLAFALAFVMMVTIGRYRFGETAALESRYGAYVLLAMAGSYLILMRLTETRSTHPAIAGLRVALIVFVAVSFIAATVAAVKVGRQWRLDRGIGAMILLNVENEPRFKIERTIHFDAGVVRGQAQQLKAGRLSVFAKGTAAIPPQALAYAAPPRPFRDLLESRPGQRVALQRLWDVYVVGPDLRHAFPPASPSTTHDLIRWAAEAARGQHYLSPQLAEFAVEYQGLRDEPGGAAGKGP